MTTEEVLTPPEWRSALPPELRTKHVHSWCPFCYLGWARSTNRVGMGCCSIFLPTGAVDTHVPAISFERESVTRKIMGMFRPRPWEASQMLKAGLDPNIQRREIPGGGEWWVMQEAARLIRGGMLPSLADRTARHAVRVNAN